MNTKAIFSGEALIEIERSRYDELLAKEERIEVVRRMIEGNFYTTVKEIAVVLGIEMPE